MAVETVKQDMEAVAEALAKYADAETPQEIEAAADELWAASVKMVDDVAEHLVESGDMTESEAEAMEVGDYDGDDDDELDDE